MAKSLEQPLVVNGWTIFAHPLFLDQLEAAIAKVLATKKKHPDRYHEKNSAKYLKAIRKVAFRAIPEDPTNPLYLQGKTLGNDYKHWRRAKFLQQYRLFFRYDTQSKTIVLAWVNDDKCLRAYNSRTDAYTTYQKMLDKGNPPDRWEDLLKEAKGEVVRLSRAARAES